MSRLAMAALAVLLLASPRAHAAATSMEQLLQQVRDARTEESRLNAEREKEFKARRDHQARLLQEALAKRAALEARSKELTKGYDANDKEINQLNQLLAQR